MIGYSNGALRTWSLKDPRPLRPLGLRRLKSRGDVGEQCAKKNVFCRKKHVRLGKNKRDGESGIGPRLPIVARACLKVEKADQTFHEGKKRG